MTSLNQLEWFIFVRHSYAYLEVFKPICVERILKMSFSRDEIFEEFQRLILRSELLRLLVNFLEKGLGRISL